MSGSGLPPPAASARPLVACAVRQLASPRWLAAGGGPAGDPPLIEARGGEKVINLHPSPLEITLTLWQTTTSPLKANEFDLFGCKNGRNRTEDAAMLVMLLGLRTDICFWESLRPLREFCAPQTSCSWIIFTRLLWFERSGQGKENNKVKFPVFFRWFYAQSSGLCAFSLRGTLSRGSFTK